MHQTVIINEKMSKFVAFMHIFSQPSFPGQAPKMQIQKESIRGPETRKTGYPLSSWRERRKEKRGLLSRCRSIILVPHPGDEPLEHTLITEHKLTQILNHAGSLGSKVFHSFDDQVETRGLKSFHVGVCAAHALSLEHIEHAVDGAEGSGAPTARAAVNQDRSLALRFGLLVSETGGARGPDNLVTLLNQIQ